MSEDNFGRIQPSACLAQLILSGTSGWSLKHLPQNSYYMMGAFSIILSHSIVGVLNFGHPESGKLLRKVYEGTTLLVEVIPLPLLNAELYEAAGLPRELVYFHLACAVFPLLTKLIPAEQGNIVKDVIALGNLSSLAYYTATVGNGPWTAGLLALMTLNSLMFKKISQRFDVPKCDVTTVGLCFFCIFGIHSLCESST